VSEVEARWVDTGRLPPRPVDAAMTRDHPPRHPRDAPNERNPTAAPPTCSSRVVRTVLLGTLACLAGCTWGRGSRPNILFMVIDSLRSDHVGFAGYKRPTTPCLDSLAAEGVAFTSCTAQAPHTMPSVPSLMTGRYPTSAIHATSVRLPNTTATLPAVQLGGEVASIATLLRQHGYASAMINVSGQVKYRILGLQAQFDFVDENVECMTKDCAARINERALRWLSRRGEGPWLCYMHYMDVHHPYDAPAEYASRFSRNYGTLPTPKFHGQWKGAWDNATPEELAHVIGMYDAEIAYLDSQICHLLRSLTALGLTKNLLVIVASDHGEELFERGGFGHGQTLYEEQTRCPLLFVWPGRVPRGATVDCPIQNIDILPTILDLVDIQELEGLQGSSLIPYFEGDCDSQPVYSERRGYSLRRGRWKLWQGDHGVARLFDLRADPAERVNLIDQEPDTSRSLHALLMDWRKSLTAPPPPPATSPAYSPDSAAVQRLHALGYLQ
jgi:arylsulfatase A-like enzyme